MTALAALIFFPFAAAISLWVAWSDMKFMKIPNKAVLALLAVYLLLGLILLPLPVYLWGLALGAIALAIGFAASAVGAVGAGDAKFVAAMAPFFVQAPLGTVMALYATCLLAAFAAHRLAARIPAFRAQTTDWESWQRSDFPMGLALTGTLLIYLILRIWPLFVPVSA